MCNAQNIFKITSINTSVVKFLLNISYLFEQRILYIDKPLITKQQKKPMVSIIYLRRFPLCMVIKRMYASFMNKRFEIIPNWFILRRQLLSNN